MILAYEEGEKKYPNMRTKIFAVLVTTILFSVVQAQNTVGLISYDITQSYQGYTLIYPHNQPNAYLLNNCGEIVHTWEDAEDFRPGNTARILSDGSLIKTKRKSLVAEDPIWAGGGGEYVEIRSWDNDLLWSYQLNNENARLHHDVEILPSGNVLMLAWEKKTKEEAIAAGRDTTLLSQDELWPDYLFEVDTASNEIVWEWHVWDHLIQDYDESKENFGFVDDHPGRVDINWDTNDAKADWMHSNSIDFSQELNQIMLSVPTFNEIWIIDHSTTTEQAATNFGGLSNHGGEILYRIGNPQTYGRGDSTDQILFYQHDAHWHNPFLPTSHPAYGSVICFNNRVGEDFSAIETFRTSWEMYEFDYLLEDDVFPPSVFENTITHPDPSSFASSGLSSAQYLPNGNLLACSGRQGYIMELTPDNEVVWEYITPRQGINQVTQGTELELNDNLTFFAFRYPPEYEAFDGKNLSSKGYLELEPNEAFCDELVANGTPDSFNAELYPVPASNFVHLGWNSGKIIDIKIHDAIGKLRIHTHGNGGMKYLDISSLEPNLYFITIDGLETRKIVVN